MLVGSILVSASRLGQNVTVSVQIMQLHIIIIFQSYTCMYHIVSLVPRLSLSLPLNFTRVNIMHKKLKERESLV